MRPSDILKHLPTVNELLEKPQVRAVLDRVPVRDVADRARTFLDNVYGELKRRSGELKVPSITELADRAARFLLHDRDGTSHIVINATGRYWSSSLPCPPLPAAAVRQVAQLTEGSCLPTPLRDEVEKRVATMAGSEAALVTSSHAAAVALGMSIVSGQNVGIARGDVGTLLDGARVADLASLAGCKLVELGASDRVTMADFQQALATQLAAVMQVELERTTTHDNSSHVDQAQLVRAAHDRKTIVIHDIGAMPLGDHAKWSELGLTSAADLIAMGVDLVILRGNGWLGGPPCGLIVGRKDLVSRARAALLASTCIASTVTLAALDGTLDAWEDESEVPLSLPPLSLALTPIENLRTRAARMAPQIAALAGVTGATVADVPPTGKAGQSSVAIQVTVAEDAKQRLRSQLASSTPAVVFNDPGASWLFDLRTVLVSQDIALVAAFQDGSTDPLAATPSDDITL